MTGDGIPDIVLAGGQSASTFALANSYFPGLGGGAFGPEVFVAADLAPNAIALVDVNADGRLDIVSANYAANTASVSVNRSGGDFASPVLYAPGGEPCQLAVADLTGDGTLDVIVVDQASTITELVHAPF